MLEAIPRSTQLYLTHWFKKKIGIGRQFFKSDSSPLFFFFHNLSLSRAEFAGEKMSVEHDFDDRKNCLCTASLANCVQCNTVRFRRSVDRNDCNGLLNWIEW